MRVGFLITDFIIFALIGFIIYTTYFVGRESKEKDMEKTIKTRKRAKKEEGFVAQLTLILLGVGALFGLIIFFKAYEPVSAGEVKVVRKFGQTSRVLQPGLNWISPFSEDTITITTRKMVYETTTEDRQKASGADYKDFPVDTNTSDGQQVDIFYTVRFAVDPYKAEEIVNNLGNMSGAVERIVKTESRIWARNIPREFTAEQLYQGDGVVEMQRRIEERVRPVFESNGLYLDSVGIREIKFTPQYVQAIEAKQIEAVNVETEKNRAEKAEFSKQAKIREAEAEAEAQRLQSQTLTDDVIEKLALEVKRIEAEALKESAMKGVSIVPSNLTVLGDNTPYFVGLPK